MKNKGYGDELKQNGIKITKQRTSILKTLENSKQPISAERIFLMLKENGISANLSTVYRTLDSLVEKNLVTKLILAGNAKALYEYSQIVHRHYLVCLGCNKMTPIPLCPLGDFENELAKKTDYSISGHKLDIYGYCPKCKDLDGRGID